jgi:toxin ParE1/3/4
MRIRWTEPAARDLTNLCDYTEDHDGPKAARRVALRIYEGLSSLTQFPRRGRPGRSPGTRELFLGGFPFSRFIASAMIPSKLAVLSTARRGGPEHGEPQGCGFD